MDMPRSPTIAVSCSTMLLSMVVLFFGLLEHNISVSKPMKTRAGKAGGPESEAQGNGSVTNVINVIAC